MKKRIILSVAFLLIFAMFAGLISGCTLVKKNDYREANEVIATVKKDGITINVTYNSMIDYFNSTYSQYAQYIQYNYFTLEQVVDFAVEGKIKNMYLLIDAMNLLTDANKVDDRRTAVLYGAGKKATVEQVLTYAEWAEAIYSVNKNMLDQIDTLRENAYQTKVEADARKFEKTNVHSIRFTEATEKYLQEEYYSGDYIDFDQIRIEIVYNGEKEGEEGEVSESFIVPKSMYSKEFSVTFGDDDQGDEVSKTFEVTLNEQFIGTDQKEKTHVISHDYTLKKPRDTKTKKNEIEGVLDKLKINDIVVSRYETKEGLKEKGIDLSGDKDYMKLDFVAEYKKLQNSSGDEHLVEAYRVLNERMKSAHKDMAYYYNAAFEIAVTNAYRSEIHQVELSKYTDEDIKKATIKELKFLYEKGKLAYGSDADKNKDDFLSAISENVSEIYYYPALEDIDQHFYVYNLLFKFSPEQEAFLSGMSENEEVLDDYRNYIYDMVTTNASNSNYDPKYECPLHGEHKEDEECSYSEDGIKDGKICPALKYARIEDGELLIFGKAEEYAEKAADVIQRLTKELSDIKDDAEKSDKDKAKESIEVFEKYMYTYNDDGGIMNNTLGYYGLNKSFQTEFLDLAKAVWDYDAVVGNAFDADGHLGIGYSSYGIHLVMISSAPFSGLDSNKALSFEDDEALLEYYKREYDVEGNSIYKDIEKKVKNKIKDSAYSSHTEKVVPTEVINRNEKNNKVTVDKEAKKSLSINKKKIREIFNDYLKYA